MPSICDDITTGNMLYDIRYIDLGDNQITDINADYSCLPNLQELNLGYNQLTSVKWLEANKNLTTLELQRNLITDIWPLQNLRNLETLKVEYNQISKASQFEAIKEVVKGLKFFSTGGNM